MAREGRGKRRRRKPGWSTEAQEIVSWMFVYGSLRSGQAERSMIADYISSSEAATMLGRIYAVDVGACFVDTDDDRVVGEVVKLNDLASAFPLLDAFEGEDYVRVLKKATLASGEEIWTWVYVLADPALAEGGELVEGGDWIAWSAANEAVTSS